MRFASLMLIALLLVISASAQEAGQVTPQPAEVAARDGLLLRGDFYLVDPARPTLLLLHELYTTRASWTAVLPALVGGGYNVLAVDLRGYGATRGAINWLRAVDDVAVWFAWLRDTAGVRGDMIFTIGSSMGSSLAIVGCGNDAACRGAVAISPGWRYYGIPVRDSLTAHPILTIYAERDRWSTIGVPRMQETAPDRVAVYTYPGNAHGMDLVAAQIDTFIPLILEWLAGHTS